MDHCDIVNNASAIGGGVLVDGKNASGAFFDFDNGSISGNIANIGSGFHGGGVCFKNGVGVIGANAIIGSNEAAGSGGGICVDEGATVTLSGSVTNNSCGANGGGVWVAGNGNLTLSGSPVITQNTKGGSANNLFLATTTRYGTSFRVVQIHSGNGLAASARIGVTTLDYLGRGITGPITGANTADYSACFVADDYSSFHIHNDSSNNVVGLASGGAFTAVTGITMTNANSVQVNTSLTLAGNVAPTTATNIAITWSVADANGTGATITPGAGVFRATTPGEATIRATVANGAEGPADYTQDFPITVVAAPPILITIPDAAFPQGNAPQITATVGADIADFGLGNLSSVELGPEDGTLALLTKDTDYEAENGSIILKLYPACLNTLMQGSYTLRVHFRNATQSYADARIDVLAPDAADDAGADIPNTGDGSMPLLWTGLILLSAAGLAVSARYRSGKQND